MLKFKQCGTHKYLDDFTENFDRFPKQIEMVNKESYRSTKQEANLKQGIS